MIKLFKYLRPYLFYVILAPVMMMLEVGGELILPAIMSKIIDVGVANNDLGYIIQHGLYMLLASAIGVFGGVSCTIFAAKASQNFGTDVRGALFEKVQSFSFVNLDKFHTSSLVTRLTNDITQLQQVVLMILRALVRAPLLFTGGLLMAFILNPYLTRILFLGVIILALTLYIIIKSGFTLFMAVQEKIDKVNIVMRENLSGVRVVKAFVRSELEKEKFAKSNIDLRDATIRAFRVITLNMPLMMVIMNVTTVIVLWVGGGQVISGQMSTGKLMAYITYLTQILMSLMMVGMVLLNITRSKACAERINKVLDTEFDIVNPQNPVENCINNGNIEFKNVMFRYPQSTGEPVLENINVKILCGQTIGILGETGAGKSTFVNLIPRLYDVSEGAILLDGIDVRNMRLEYLRQSIGVVLQKSILFSGTIKDNIKWGKPEATDEEVYDAAKKAQAYDFIMQLPDKFNTEIGQMGVNLSGGQKQRISIARTIIKEPKILILDDSTSALDLTTESKIQSMLIESMPNTTKIIIAQKISSVMQADNIIVIQSGTIAGFGKHDELLKTNDLYRDIYNSQIKEEAI